MWECAAARRPPPPRPGRRRRPRRTRSTRNTRAASANSVTMVPVTGSGRRMTCARSSRPAPRTGHPDQRGEPDHEAHGEESQADSGGHDRHDGAPGGRAQEPGPGLIDPGRAVRGKSSRRGGSRSQHGRQRRAGRALDKPVTGLYRLQNVDVILRVVAAPLDTAFPSLVTRPRSSSRRGRTASRAAPRGRSVQPGDGHPTPRPRTLVPGRDPGPVGSALECTWCDLRCGASGRRRSSCSPHPSSSSP